jgi:hypothetical protein
MYDSGNYIHAKGTAKAAVDTILHRDVGNKKKLTVVLEVTSQRGSRQRVKFKGLEQG